MGNWPQGAVAVLAQSTPVPSHQGLRDSLPPRPTPDDPWSLSGAEVVSILRSLDTPLRPQRLPVSLLTHPDPLLTLHRKTALLGARERRVSFKTPSFNKQVTTQIGFAGRGGGHIQQATILAHKLPLWSCDQETFIYFFIFRCAGSSLQCRLLIAEHRFQGVWASGVTQHTDSAALQPVGPPWTKARTHVSCTGRRILSH